MTAIRDERAALLADADNYLAERLAEWNDRETAIAEKEADLERREADLGRSLAEVLKVERVNVVLRGQVDALEAKMRVAPQAGGTARRKTLSAGLRSLIESNRRRACKRLNCPKETPRETKYTPDLRSQTFHPCRAVMGIDKIRLRYSITEDGPDRTKGWKMKFSEWNKRAKIEAEFPPSDVNPYMSDRP